MVVRDRIQLKGQPFKVSFSEAQGSESLLVLNTRGYISRVDLDTREVVAQSPILRQGIMTAVVNPEGTRLLTWYTSGSTLYVLDTSTLEVLARLKCGTNLGVALFSHDGRQAIVSAVQSRRVCIVDMESLDIVHKIAFPKAIGHLSLLSLIHI